MVHVEVLPLAEASDAPDVVLAQPAADNPGVLRVVEVVDHVGRQDLLGVDQLDAVVGPQDLRQLQGLDGALDRRVAVEAAPLREGHLGGDGALARRHRIGAEGGRERQAVEGERVLVEVDPVLVRDVRPVDSQVDAVDPLVDTP